MPLLPMLVSKNQILLRSDVLMHERKIKQALQNCIQHPTEQSACGLLLGLLWSM